MRFLAALLVLAAVVAAEAKPTRRVCRKACENAVFACYRESGKWGRCVRDQIRLCRKGGIAACELTPGETTTTTTTTLKGATTTRPLSTTTTTIPKIEMSVRDAWLFNKPSAGCYFAVGYLVELTNHSRAQGLTFNPYNWSMFGPCGRDGNVDIAPLPAWRVAIDPSKPLCTESFNIPAGESRRCLVFFGDDQRVEPLRQLTATAYGCNVTLRLSMFYSDLPQTTGPVACP